MGFSISRCPPKGKLSSSVTANSTSKLASKNDNLRPVSTTPKKRRRLRLPSRPPIPSFQACSELDKLEQMYYPEKTQQDDNHSSSKPAAPMNNREDRPSCKPPTISHPPSTTSHFPGFTSSEEEENDNDNPCPLLTVDSSKAFTSQCDKRTGQPISPVKGANVQGQEPSVQATSTETATSTSKSTGKESNERPSNRIHQDVAAFASGQCTSLPPHKTWSGSSKKEEDGCDHRSVIKACVDELVSQGYPLSNITIQHIKTQLGRAVTATERDIARRYVRRQCRQQQQEDEQDRPQEKSKEETPTKKEFVPPSCEEQEEIDAAKDKENWTPLGTNPSLTPETTTTKILQKDPESFSQGKEPKEYEISSSGKESTQNYGEKPKPLTSETLTRSGVVDTPTTYATGSMSVSKENRQPAISELPTNEPKHSTSIVGAESQAGRTVENPVSKPSKSTHLVAKDDGMEIERKVEAPPNKNRGQVQKQPVPTLANAEDDDCEIVEVEQVNPAPPKRQRGRPKKEAESTDKSCVPTGKEESSNNYVPKRKRTAGSTRVEKITMEDAEPDNIAAKQVASRKRARKGTCALCITCSCRGKTEQGDGEVAIFARSDAAIEKALIRRVQSMEKTSELNDSRLEMFRRKLKQHRREMWKKREKQHEEKRSSNRFLPDAKDLEVTSSAKGSKISRGLVKKAQKNMFSGEVPLVQANLMAMGFSSKLAEQLQKTIPSNELETIPEEQEEEDQEEEAEVPKEERKEEEAEGFLYYSSGVDYADQVHRQQWKCQTTSPAKEEGYSIWNAHRQATVPGGIQYDSILHTQVADEEEDSMPPSCPWDSLFARDETELCDDHGGMSQLVHLLAEENASVTSGDCAKGGLEWSPKRLSQLSVRGKESAAECIEAIEQEKGKIKRLQAVCPSWKENVAFAMKQSDPETVRNALSRVQQKRQRMIEHKRKLLEMWDNQDAALQLFEDSLQTSLKRLDQGTETESNYDETAVDRFHFQSPTKEYSVPAETTENGFFTQTATHERSDSNIHSSPTILSPSRCREEEQNTMMPESPGDRSYVFLTC